MLNFSQYSSIFAQHALNGMQIAFAILTSKSPERGGWLLAPSK
jgi:hypothetical protein